MTNNTVRHIKILFLFSGSSNRAKILDEVARGENADTGLRGCNHILGAEFIDVEETVRGVVPAWVYRLLPWQARSFILYPRILKYDVVIAQDDLLLGYAISMTRRVLRTRCRWIYIAINSSVLMRRHQHHVVRFALLKIIWKSFARIVCLSTVQMHDFTRAGIPPEHLVFVPFGIGADFFRDVSRTDEEDLVASVGRDLGRDYPTLFAAAEQIQCPFVIVAAYKNISPDRVVPSNVAVLYNKTLAETRALYARARLVVIASKKEESSEGSDCSGQTVILDAMAAGVPVVATSRPWIADYFVPGEDLVVVEPGDAEALAGAIRDLFADDKKRARLAEAARAKVQERYTTRMLATALEQVVRTVI